MRFQDESTNRYFDRHGDSDVGDSLVQSRSMTRRFGAQLALAVSLVLWLPLPALAAKLVEVRVGRHPGYTRVVLQTDSPAGYELTRSKSGNILIVLDADASPRRLASKSEVLREVIVESTGEGALARLKLRRTDVAVKEMVLKSPPRIVLDLTPGVPQPTRVASKPAAAAPKTPSEPEPVEVAAAEPSPAAVQPPESARGPEPTPVSTAGAAAGGRLADSKVKSSAEAKSGVAGAPDSETRGGSETGSGSDAALAVETPPGADPEPTEAADASEDRGTAEADSEKAVVAAAAEPAAEDIAKAELREMPKPPPVERRKPVHPAPAAMPQTPGALAFLPSPFDDPLVLGGIGGLLVLVVALVAVRRRGAHRAEEDLDSPFAPSEPLTGEEAPVATTESFDVPAPAEETSADGDLPVMPGFAGDAEAPKGFEVGDSLFAREAEAEEEKESDGRAFAPASVVEMGAAEAPPLGGDVMRAVEELERRMGQMETRLEEVVDAKERLERQVSAQTEELRVQRAAIARTQRVLRNVSRPEDEATEPAPKV